MNRSSSAPAPAVFFGHGSPMNTLERNAHTDAWREFGTRVARPRAILVVSAHWWIGETAVTAMRQPRTIHDFRGFPPELFAFDYPAAGDTALATRVRELIAPTAVREDHDWGLDHGTWSVLAHVYPRADVPVVQLAIDRTRPAAFHVALGRALRPLRDDGVMILASGNVVHNLAMLRAGPNAHPYPWASEFATRLRAHLLAGDYDALLDPHAIAGGEFAVPTPEHYQPLLYLLGAAAPGERAELITEGIELGSIDMMSFAFAAAR